MPGDNPARPEARYGQGDWLHTLPGRWSTTLWDPVFRWGLQQRMGFAAPGAGEGCGRTPPGGKRCNHPLDTLGRHAGICNKGLYTKRHDRIRDRIALVVTRRESRFTPNKTCFYWVRPKRMESLPRAVSDPSTEGMCISLSLHGQNSGWMCAAVRIHTVNSGLLLPGVSHVKLPMKRCRATGGCSSYSVTLASVALLDDCKITHLVCVRLKHLLYDFCKGGRLDLCIRKQQGGGPKDTPKSHIANVLGGHRLDE